MPLSDGTLTGYLPVADAYGKPIYQSEIAIVAAGSLETVIDRVADAVESVL